MLQKRHYQAARQALSQGKSWVRRSNVWDEIAEHTGIGRLTKGGYRISEPEWSQLRRALERDTGRDPMLHELGGDRMEQVRYGANEKLARQGVFEQSVIVSTLGEAAVPMVDGDFRLPRSLSFVGLRGEQIDLERLSQQRLVVIENGTLFHYCRQLSFPSPWDHSVLVYRGHGASARDVRSLINNQPAQNLAMFFDFDPAGIAMAIDAGKGSIVIPRNWSSMTHQFQGNKVDAFHAQQEQLQRAIGASGSTELGDVLRHMSTQQLAVTQEALLSHKVALTTLSVP
ncbi:hypothetical protein [Salicola sp. Rm-C-2C1-2]|uniref:DUF7281 domain-containing protein n=1 Tax=Salicola sp. Rm-C-2C1-2 TaxID=3141321 RepID=UPI0032E40E7B